MQEHNSHAETNPWLFHRFEEKQGGSFTHYAELAGNEKFLGLCDTQQGIRACVYKILPIRLDANWQMSALNQIQFKCF